MPDVDLSEIEAFDKPNRERQPCAVVKTLEHLKPKDRALLDAACARPQKGEGSLSNMALEKWLDAKGHKVTWQAIRNHRSQPRVCACRYD